MDQRSSNVITKVNPKLQSFVLFASFYAAWFGALLASFSSLSWLMSLGAVLPYFFIFAWFQRRRGRSLLNWLPAVALCSILGATLDSTLLSLDYFNLGVGQSWSFGRIEVLPFWYFAIWAAFALSLSDWAEYPLPLWLCLPLGAFGGPASYYAAEKLAVVDVKISYVSLALIWMLLFPLLIFINRKISKLPI